MTQLTPAQAARAVAGDYDLVGDPSAEWMALAFRRFADKLDPPLPEHNYRAYNCRHNSHIVGHYDADAHCCRCCREGNDA